MACRNEYFRRGIQGGFEVFEKQFGGDGDDYLAAVSRDASNIYCLIVSTSSSLFGVEKPSEYAQATFFAVLGYKSMAFKRGVWMTTFSSLAPWRYGEVMSNPQKYGAMAIDGTYAYFYQIYYTSGTNPPTGNYTRSPNIAKVDLSTLDITLIATPAGVSYPATIPTTITDICLAGDYLYLYEGTDPNYTDRWLHIASTTFYGTGAWLNKYHFFGIEKGDGTLNSYSLPTTGGPYNPSRYSINSADFTGAAYVLPTTAYPGTYPCKAMGGLTDDTNSDVLHFFGYADPGKKVIACCYDKDAPNTMLGTVDIIADGIADWTTFMLRVASAGDNNFLMAGTTDAGALGIMNGFVILGTATDSAPFYTVTKRLILGEAGKRTLAIMESHLDGFTSKYDASLNPANLLVGGTTNGSLYAPNAGGYDCWLKKTNLTI